jgi:hypothetical protein
MKLRSLGIIAWAPVTAAIVLTGCATTKTAEPAKAATPVATVKSVANARAANQIPMAEILDDPKKLAVLQKYAPALATNPQLSMARAMTLADVAGYAQAGLSPEMVKSIVDDINKL